MAIWAIGDNMSYGIVEEKAATSFFSKKNAPNHITKRTGTTYGSMPLLDLKAKGIWSSRLERMVKYLPKDAFIAGGFLRSMIAGEDELDGDVDFFFKTEDAFEKVLSMIKEPPDKVFNYYTLPENKVHDFKKFRIVDCESAANFRPNLQLVRLFWFDGPEHVIDSFDFTVCQFVTDGKTLWFGPKSFEDVQSRTLRWHRETGDAIAALNRIIKYQHKGYKISQELFDITEQQVLKMLNSPDELSKHFRQDKIESEIHKHGESVYQRAWDYLSSAPVTRSAAIKALKKKDDRKTSVDKVVRTSYSYDGS